MFTRPILNFLQRNGGRILGILMILVFLGASLPQATAMAQDDDCQDTYVVEYGDFLVKIAQQYTGVTFQDIAIANDLEPPYTLRFGQELCIPRPSSTTSSGSSASSSSDNIAVKKSGDKLEITVSGLDRNEYYFVRVDNAGKAGYEWFKIGVLHTDNDREGDGRYTLPDELKNASSFTVCLKNTDNDDLVCTDSRLSTVDLDSSSGSGSGGSEEISFRRRGGKLEVTVQGLQRNAHYFVRVDDADRSGIEWFKIGLLSTDGDREGKGSFTLPDELDNADSFTVCLKNTSTDDLICSDPALTRYQEDEDESGSTDTKNASFTVTRLSTSIIIRTSRFPKNSFWNIKVREWGGNVQDWSELGILRNGDAASGSYTFTLPQALRDEDLYVCAKNLVTNDVKCVVSSQ